MIREIDASVGRLRRALEATGVLDDTVFIFTSDNGPEKSWKQRIDDFGHRSNGRYRGGKRDIYEGGHRVPFFVRWPGGIESPGRECDDLICQTDLLATFAEMLEEKLPGNAGEDSQSFLSVLRDPSYEHARQPLISHSAKGRFAITDGHWKLVMAHGKDNEELYDLSLDHGETTDVIASASDRAAALRKKITAIVTNGRTTPGKRQQNDTGYWSDLTWIKPEQFGINR